MSRELDAALKTYESRALLGQYLSLHYGPIGEAYPSNSPSIAALKHALDFPKRCGEIVIRYAASVGIAGGRALDVGCAVGRSTFEMTRLFSEVIGIDLSSSFIAAANTMRDEGAMPYDLPVEGRILKSLIAELPADVNAKSARFIVGDACNLPDTGSVDAILAANLLCRVPSPRLALQQMDERLNPGGVLVLTSPFTWMEDYTPLEQWLGGVEGESSAAGLVAALGPNYEVLQEGEEALLIREHSRKYQLINAHLLVARKRAASD